MASVSSAFVPSILNLLFSGSMAPKRGISAWNRLLSDVWRSTSTVVGVKLIVEESLTIFLRNSEATTDVPVW